MKYPQNTWTWNGNKVKSTWIKTKDISKYSPITQVYGIIFNDKDEILICRKGNGDWQIPGGHPEKGETINQTSEREMLDIPDNKPHYQVRCIAKLKKLLPQTPDPDNGETWERKFVPASEITSFVKWNITGDAMFKDAINSFDSLK